MKKVYLVKGQNFQLIPAVVSVGDDENTKSLSINMGAIYDKVLTGLPVGHEIVIGKFESAPGKVHPVIVEQGTGKFYYDEELIVGIPEKNVRSKFHKGRWYLGAGSAFTLTSGAIIKLGGTATMRGATFDFESAIELAAHKRDLKNITDGISNGVEIGSIVDSETGEDLPVYFERHTERFYFYEPEPKAAPDAE
jgi:hypothetical protein